VILTNQGGHRGKMPYSRQWEGLIDCCATFENIMVYPARYPIIAGTPSAPRSAVMLSNFLI
jgi:hypothetical protein